MRLAIWCLNEYKWSLQHFDNNGIEVTVVPASKVFPKDAEEGTYFRARGLQPQQSNLSALSQSVFTPQQPHLSISIFDLAREGGFVQQRAMRQRFA